MLERIWESSFPLDGYYWYSHRRYLQIYSGTVVCLNIELAQFNAEHGCIHNVVSVRKQCHVLNNIKESQCHFVFQLKKTENTSIQMMLGVTVFSGSSSELKHVMFAGRTRGC